MKQLEKIIRQLIKIQVVQATVSAIDGDQCTVRTLDETKEIFKCSLNAVRQNGQNKLIVYPKEGSTVVIAIFENQETASILSYSEVDKLYFQKGTAELEADKEGFKVKRENENLKDVLNDWQAEFGKLCDELSKVVVSIGTSPNVPAIQAIKQKVSLDIKQRLNKILKN